MRQNDFNHFQNKECRYFPCHDTVPREDFNCLFCYCPLYLYDDCGGNHLWLDNGIKDCSKCTRNHDKDSWKFVVSRLREIMDIKVKFSRI
jgi:Zn-finger protein